MELNRIYHGDCLEVIKQFDDNSIDVVCTSPPYWGQRSSKGVGVENDPREYLRNQIERFVAISRILKPSGIMWINIGDAYNTPVNWSPKDHKYSSLGADRSGFDEDNKVYVKPRHARKAFVDKNSNWLKYGNLLALPQRLIVGLADGGLYYRGEVIWRKRNPLPEGKCRRPHRSHEGIYLFAKTEQHQFQVKPPVKSVWEFASDGDKSAHFSRFPRELPRQCISAYGKTGKDVIVLDPYAGSGTTGLVALEMGCSFIGIEIDEAFSASGDKMIVEKSKTNEGIGRANPK